MIVWQGPPPAPARPASAHIIPWAESQAPRSTGRGAFRIQRNRATHRLIYAIVKIRPQGKRPPTIHYRKVRRLGAAATPPLSGKSPRNVIYLHERAQKGLAGEMVHPHGGVVSENFAGAPLNELPMSTKKEQFSLGYVRMVAAAAGVSIKSHATDVDGVDITLASSAEYEMFYCPQFELQLKCTSQRRTIHKDHIVWTLKAGPFRRLTHPKRHIPAYLGVLYVPAESDEWMTQNEELLLVRSRMYWQSAAKLGTIKDTQDTKTVHLPSSNLFDVDQLRDIMETIGKGGDW